MGDLETKLRQAGDELRSIRGHLNVLKSIPTKRTEEKAGALTFRSTREKGQSIKRPELDTLKNQLTILVELDKFRFSH